MYRRQASATSAPASQSAARMDAQEHHRHVLLRALETGRPVLVGGKQHFIHTITNYQAGGGIATAVYLAGSKTALEAGDVELAPELPTITGERHAA